MKKIAIFCIPAHGHTNPILPVAAELVRRGNKVRFYSFDEFEEKITATGAEYISCSRFLAKLTEQEEKGLKEISTTEMTIQDIRITRAMADFLDEEYKNFQPDVVYSDSVCFWGKLSAWKYNVPLVVSTSTFAFNQLSSQYMKRSAKETADLMFGLPRVLKELKTLEPYGFKVKNPISLVQSDNNTDSVVYTSRRFQPYAESFSDHFEFVGPSVFSKIQPNKAKERPLVYISMGTIINDRPDFYKKCIDTLGKEDVSVIISCGNAVDPESFGSLPQNVQMFHYVDQLDVLSKTDVFITHCGMNSVSESLYMAAPMVLYPQTNEQYAVARKVCELGAGVMLDDDSAAGIGAAVKRILDSKSYSRAAEECSADFRSCKGAEGAADFIENAPHNSNGTDVVAELNRKNTVLNTAFWIIAIAAAILLSKLLGWQFSLIWMIAVNVAFGPFRKAVQNMNYMSLTAKK